LHKNALKFEFAISSLVFLESLDLTRLVRRASKWDDMPMDATRQWTSWLGHYVKLPQMTAVDRPTAPIVRRLRHRHYTTSHQQTLDAHWDDRLRYVHK